MSNTQTDITIHDLVQIKRIFEVVSLRGGIHANEMYTVGVIYDKLQNILKKVEDTQPEENSESSP